MQNPTHGKGRMSSLPIVKDFNAFIPFAKSAILLYCKEIHLKL